MENIGTLFLSNLITIAILASAIGLVLFIRAILKFAGKKGISFFAAIPAYFAVKRTRKDSKLENELILEGLDQDRIAEAKSNNYQGTTELKYFYSKNRAKQLKKQAKKEKKLK